MIKYQQIGPTNQLMLVTFNSYSITNKDDRSCRKCCRVSGECLTSKDCQFDTRLSEILPLLRGLKSRINCKLYHKAKIIDILL